MTQNALKEMIYSKVQSHSDVFVEGMTVEDCTAGLWGYGRTLITM